MGVANTDFFSRINISAVNSTQCAVYRAWDAVINKLTGGMAGKVTIVGCSAGTVGAGYADAGWTSGTSPGSGGYAVLQFESARADASKLHVFIGCRDSTGTLAGFGSKTTGLWVCVSPNGGWVQANGYFGATLADPRNGTIKVVNAFSGASTLGIILTPGVAGTRPGTLTIVIRQGSGTNGQSCHAGACIAAQGRTDSVYRAVNLVGLAAMAGSGWGSTTGGFCMDAALSVAHTAQAWPQSEVPQMDADGTYPEADCWVQDLTGARFVGLMDGVRRTAAGDGALSADGTRWAWGGLSFWRDAAGDGTW